MDLIQRLIDLRQSGTGAVVSEAGITEMQSRMHVPDAIEDWVYDRISQWRDRGRLRPLLVMLSGNAGDGKSDLIERLVGRLGDTSDIAVVRDATHAEKPTDDQTALLIDFFAQFADDFEGGDPHLSLIAMNTGMALSFFKSALGGGYDAPLGTLEAVVKRELGLSPSDASPPWEYEVVNLDRRSVLSHNAQPALFTGMLDKLDPANPDGILFDEAKQCEGCCAREWCFVHTNVQALQVPAVRESLTDLLWLATLSGEVHLSPRNIWDFIYHITTGGAEFFEGTPSPCDRIIELSHLGPAAVADVHRRVVYNLLFEAPDTASMRGPVLEALANADPTRRVGRNGHAAESAAYNDPAEDADALAKAARVVGIGASGDESSAPDPCLNNLAVLLQEASGFESEMQALVAQGVLRRAALLGAPSSISSELADSDLAEFSGLLDDYRTWGPATEVPDAVYAYKDLLEEAIRKIFGARVGGNTYFRQDSFSPSTRFAAFSHVDLGEEVTPAPDEDVTRGPGWLDAVNYRPRYISVMIGKGEEQAWPIRGDFALYRLFNRVKAGYAASSVDLEAFFGLRFACERLGGSSPDTSELVIRDLTDGHLYRLREKTALGKKTLELTAEPG